MKEITKIIQTYQKIDWSKEKVALGTVVKVEGSAYRRIGARMFVRNNGLWVGGISGGCLEGDALKRAQMAIMKNESSIVVYDTTEDDPHQIGVGLGCNGRIEVLFSPINPEDKSNQIEYLSTIINNRKPTILFQILNINGGEGKLRGAFYQSAELEKMAADIQISEEEIEEKIKFVSVRKKSRVFTFQSRLGDDYEILLEFIRPRIRLICVGDNYDINAFMGIASTLGWEIHVAGKARKLNKVVYQNAQKVHTLEEGKSIEIDDYTALILMSHDYKTDLGYLKNYLDSEIPYLGLLGPKKRMLKMQDELTETGNEIDLTEKINLFSPVGLDIGAESPDEIALAIAAEIVAVFRNRDGGYLRKREGSIYERNL